MVSKKKNLVDICEIDFCRPAVKSHQNVIHSPVKIDFCSFNLIIPTELSEFVALTSFSDNTGPVV